MDEKIKVGQSVITPHGEAKVTRIESVQGSHDDRISVQFPNEITSQYTSSSITTVEKDEAMREFECFQVENHLKTCDKCNK